MGEGRAIVRRFAGDFHGGAASVVIIANAVFLQIGPHPTPFFANPTTPPQAADGRSTLCGGHARSPRKHSPPPVSPPANTAGHLGATQRSDRRSDRVGHRHAGRVMAVQRVLSEFGYGQIKPSGILDEPTSAAIEKFERDHKLPVTGRLSDRLLTGLAAMAGRPLD